LRFIVSVVAVATTLGGMVAMAVHDARLDAPPAVALTAPTLAAPGALAALEPIPSLEPIQSLPELAPAPARDRTVTARAAPAARPVALATTRSSR
jgi:hypothetical protein